MGEFVHMMAERRWIEGTVGPRKSPGAYCTGFAKSRTPRVYTTFTGGASDVITLAHELGHAYHSWVMRDLPESQRSYGMSLAETASTFGETLVRDAMLQQASAPQARLEVAWVDMSALVTFVLNIPTRFEFEKGFYERRQERPLRPAELAGGALALDTTCFVGRAQGVEPRIVSGRDNDGRIMFILPLGLYLITFIISFDSPRWYNRTFFGSALK